MPNGSIQEHTFPRKKKKKKSRRRREQSKRETKTENCRLFGYCVAGKIIIPVIPGEKFAAVPHAILGALFFFSYFDSFFSGKSGATYLDSFFSGKSGATYLDSFF